jgi:hypothetical protein
MPKFTVTAVELVYTEYTIVAESAEAAEEWQGTLLSAEELSRDDGEVLNVHEIT